MDSFPTLPLPLRLPGHGAVDAAFVGASMPTGKISISVAFFDEKTNRKLGS